MGDFVLGGFCAGGFCPGGFWLKKFFEPHYVFRLQKPISRNVGVHAPRLLRHCSIRMDLAGTNTLWSCNADRTFFTDEEISVGKQFDEVLF